MTSDAGERLANERLVETVSVEHLLRQGCLDERGVDDAMLASRIARALDGQLAEVLSEVAQGDASAPVAFGVARWFIVALAGSKVIGQGLARVAAGYALDAEERRDEQRQGAYTSAVGTLADELPKHFGRIASNLRVSENPLGRLDWLMGDDASPVTDLRDVAVQWAEGFCKHVGLYAEGKATADEVLAKVAKAATNAESTPVEVMKLWLCEAGFEVPRWAVMLARVVWRQHVKPRWRKPYALVRVVHDPIVRLHTAKPEVDRNGQRALPLGDAALRRVAVVTDAVEKLVGRGIELFSTLTAHRLIRAEISLAHQRALDGHSDARVLTFDGGFTTLAHDVLQLTSKQAASELQAIVEAQHSCEIQVPPHGAYTRLLIRTFTPAAGRRRARLELVLGTALLPHFVHDLKQDGLRDSHALHLVPLLPIPPLVGARGVHAAQASLSMMVVSHLRANAVQLVDHGGVVIDDATWARMAAEAHLSRAMLPRVIDRWVQDGPDEPALLRRLDGNRFALGDAHGAAQAFIEAAGRDSMSGAAAGVRSAASKRAKLRRLAGREKR